MAHLDTVTQQPAHPPAEPSEGSAPRGSSGRSDPWSWTWSARPFETREVRKARERADRAARRARRAEHRVHEAQARAGQRTGARQLVDAAGDAATAALTAVSVAADEAHARLAAKARMRELEHAVVTTRAGGTVDVSPPTRDEAMKLVRRMEPGSSEASMVRGLGFVVAGVVALAMTTMGGFGWLGFIVPLAILISAGSLGDRVQAADRNRKAGRIQVELARASLLPTERAPAAAMDAAVRAAAATAGLAAARPRLIEDGDPRTHTEVIAVVDRLIGNVRGSVPESDLATLGRIRDEATRALPTTDGPLDLTDHDVWLARQICIDYLPGALAHYIALPADRASEPLLDGRSARQVLDEQLEMFEHRLEELATRSYRREANGLLVHARFVAESLRPDPFDAWLADAAADRAEQPVATLRDPVRAADASVVLSEEPARVRERA